MIEEKNGKKYTVHPTGARSSVISNTLEIPLHCLERVANIFQEGREGEHAYDTTEEKNYAFGGDSFILDRLNHADAHLRKYAEGDRSEDHLAKIGWAVVVAMMWEKKKERQAPKAAHRKRCGPSGCHCGSEFCPY